MSTKFVTGTTRVTPLKKHLFNYKQFDFLHVYGDDDIRWENEAVCHTNLRVRLW